MMHNNLGMVLMKLHEPTEAEKEAAREREEAERLANPQLFKSTLQRPKNKNANRNKALERAKTAFGKAIELDNQYIKPLYQRMTIHKEEEEYEEAVADAKRIEEIDPTFKGIRTTIIELERQ